MWLTELEQRIGDPFETISQVRDEMHRLLDQRAGRTAGPALNVWTGDKGAVVTAELPGVDPADLDISVNENILTISGTRKWDEPAEDDSIHRMECPNGVFSRALELPFRVDAGRIQAACSKGVLNVTLPRVEQDKPKKIQVKAA